MIEERFKDAKWFGYPVDVVIGGAGGIGSWLSLLVSRLGYRTFVYDMDYIEGHNIGTQFYMSAQSEMSKARAVEDNCENFGNSITAFDSRYTEESMVASVMMSGFDNMEARKLFFRKWKDYVLKGNIMEEKVKLFVDGRMTAETGQIYFVKSKKDIELYESTLFDDSEVDDGPCSYKATPHNGPLIASLMVSGLVSSVFNKSVDEVIRHVPFEVSFRIPEFVIDVKETKEYYDTVFEKST